LPSFASEASSACGFTLTWIMLARLSQALSRAREALPLAA
jgi:hypothetical protein